MCRRTPVTPIPYPMPAPVDGGIWIKKECLPSPFGGIIHCIITVTNSGDTMPDAPVTFLDAATILAGPGAGGAVTIVAVAPDVPQWVVLADADAQSLLHACRPNCCRPAPATPST